jgi:hypothetical protein
MKDTYLSHGALVLESVDSAVTVCSNWARARFLDALDLTPAVMSKSRATPLARQGTCTAYWGSPVSFEYGNFRDVFIIYGKDGNENYSVQASLRQETWDLIQEKFREFV